MAIKKKSGGGGGANWMDTYGDMVTLLLCFFVLLYSMSTISEDKWKAIVQSFNPNSIEAPTMIDGGNEGPLADPTDGSGMDIGNDPGIKPEDIEAALEALYEALQSMSESSGAGEAIEVTRGDGYVFVSFADAVFFDGDSAVLRPDGQAILDMVIEAINPAVPYIDELRVMGHTAQARPDRPNDPEGDRRLASNRAVNVVIYIQKLCDIDPARLIGVGYGQWRPVDKNDTPEHRAHNRRVELLITGKDIESKLGDALEQYTSIRTGGSPESAAEAPADAPASEG
ncbi:MAG: flagellar motor protein MotB [Oscillospiraceae bacterium]|nr:flagellar motor protein MotB [Oscillospiraceae bacterium]